MCARDKVRVAQVDDTRAQILIAEGKHAQAALIARTAARCFERAETTMLLSLDSDQSRDRVGLTTRTSPRPIHVQQAIEMIPLAPPTGIRTPNQQIMSLRTYVLMRSVAYQPMLICLRVEP